MSTDSSQPRIGLLLAAGRGSRFDPAGHADKLLATIDGRPAVLHAHASLAPAVDEVIAVVRPGPRGKQVAESLRPAGCTIVICALADAGMGHSLACAASHAIARAPTAVVVMLGDMPFVHPGTVARLVDAVHEPAEIVAPLYQGRRGHPVVFGASHLPALTRLDGDRGAADLLRRHPPKLLDMLDAGVLHDIDTLGDLQRGQACAQR